MRKVRSLQHLSGGAGTNVTDYPTHSRKILAVVDQQGQESQMPEHVTVGDHKPAPHREQAHREPLHKEYARIKRQHTYEQVELPIAEEHNGSAGNLRPQEVEGLVASVKRSNRWSPGLSARQDQPPRVGSAGRRGSVPSKAVTVGESHRDKLSAKQDRPPRVGSAGRRGSVPSRVVAVRVSHGDGGHRHGDRTGIREPLDTVSLQDADLEWSAQAKHSVGYRSWYQMLWPQYTMAGGAQVDQMPDTSRLCG